MQKEEFIQIAKNIAEGLATDQEKQLFLFHLNTFSAENPEWEQLDVEYRNQIQTLVQEDIRTQIFGESKPKAKTAKLWTRIGIAAAVATIIVSAGIWLLKPTTIEPAPTEIVKQDIAPGKQGATLTLANGKQIRLGDAKDGELAKQAGVTVSKTADGQLIYTVADNNTNNTNEINTLSTTKGETYQVRLPDGTSVWLNAASSLTYSANLVERGKRRVRLDGEGYFEVAKDKSKPFVVSTGDQEVEVLGTQFNINGYSDEGNIETTLVEGSVRVSGSKSKLIIKPGEQATLTNGKFVAKEIDLEEVMDWKNGDFIFNQEPIESAMRKLARWYDIEVVYQGDIPTDGLQCAISKYRNLSQVLNVLEQTKIAKFKIEGRRVIVNRYTK